MEYKALFKCRLCGEKYRYKFTDDEEIAFRAALSISTRKTKTEDSELYNVHCCENGGFGISDFLGFMAEEDGQQAD